jgi:hypothetical protein
LRARSLTLARALQLVEPRWLPLRISPDPRVGFGDSSVMNSSTETSSALATGTADSSPVTEFYNAGLQKDDRFVGVTNNCVANTVGETAGCVMSLVWFFSTVNARSTARTALAAAGGTSCIIVDNDIGLSRRFERLRCDQDRRRPWQKPRSQG